MMKKGIILIAFIGLAHALQAQTFSEWFRQKKTQKKYLIEQIAALKVYAEFAGRGYKIGKDGLNIIGRIKDGDFNLHRDFFGSLKFSNPAIKRYPRVADIIGLQQQIMTVSGNTLKVLGRSSKSNSAETTYYRSVFVKVYQDCDQDLAMLEDLIGSDGQLTMTDDERLIRIDGIHASMQQRYGFTRKFSNGILSLVGNRERELREVEEFRKLHGLK